MKTKSNFETREQYLTEASNLILDDLLMPLCAEKERPQFRISIGFPKHTRGGKAVAVCFNRASSTDGVNEIFINPEIDEPIQVLEANVHELIHAIDDCVSGHKGFFARVAREAGLAGPLTATVADNNLKSTLEGYIALLGDFPHHKMNTEAGRKKDGTRQRKVECTDCGFLFRTSGKQISRIRHDAACPCCDSRGTLTVEEK
jgi:hypothetical protein